MVVEEIESGRSLADVRRKYGIGGCSTVQAWLRVLGKNHLLNKIVRIETMNETDRLKQLEAENRQLKLKLADAYLAKDCLEELVKQADKLYKTDLKKSFGTVVQPPSKGDTA
jgi:transposase-like protein